MESVSALSSAHAIVSVYASTSASPETTCICWPSFSILSSVTMFSSSSVRTRVRVGQALELPRYTQRSSQSAPETQVDAVPMLVICRKEAVGVKDGVALGAAEGSAEGTALSADDGAALGVAEGSADGAPLGVGDGSELGTRDGAGEGSAVVGARVGAAVNET